MHASSSGASTARPSSSASGSQALVVSSPPASAALGDPLTIAFCVTDHSLVCMKLDMAGSLNASLSHGSSSSARASTLQSSGGGSSHSHMANLLSGSSGGSSSGSAAAALGGVASPSSVSRYARILFSFLWISVMDVTRTAPRQLTLRVLIAPRTAVELRKNERVKALFPFAVADQFNVAPTAAGAIGSAAPTPAAATTKSGGSFFSSSSSSSKSLAPLLLTLHLPCNTAGECEQLFSMLRLAHARARAESATHNSADANAMHTRKL